MICFLINLYIILEIIYKGENFTVTLDSEYGRESGLVIYESLDDKSQRTYLKSADIDFFTDICINWLPKDIDEEGEGSHHGEHYIAYTFYAENMGQETINYWARIDIDDVIKNVDKAIRIMVYRNGERTIYARPNERTGEAEKETVTEKFYSDTEVCLEQRTNFEPGQIDKFTIVVYLEGDDPDCVDELIGGELKMHMDITEEHFIQETDNEIT